MRLDMFTPSWRQQGPPQRPHGVKIASKFPITQSDPASVGNTGTSPDQAAPLIKRPLGALAQDLWVCPVVFGTRRWMQSLRVLLFGRWGLHGLDLFWRIPPKLHQFGILEFGGQDLISLLRSSGHS